MKVIIATGGTGGHIFPAINVGIKLKRDGHEVWFVGKFGEAMDQLRKKGFTAKELDVFGYSHQESLKWSGSMLKATKRCLRTLKDVRPDVVMGFGGYASFPVVLAASIRQCPILIHEQNVIPGKANKVLSNFANRIAVSFEKTKKYFKSSKTILTGCPCRYTAKQAERSGIISKFGLKEDKTTILVFGGSQGSHRINMEFVDAVKGLKDKENLQVIHITGKTDFGMLNKEYKQMGIPYVLYEFLDDIALAYQVADLVISRAGAGTITEITLFRKPAVLIPYPYAGNHQRENALMLEELGVAKMIEEKNLTTTALSNAVLGILPNKLSLDEIDKRVKGVCFPEASTSLVKEALSLVK